VIPARERRISAAYAGLPLTGVSLAGRETYFVFPTLGLSFDMGRAPTDLVPVANVFLSHAHLDHAGGLAYWCSQRRLLRLPGGVVRTHPAAVSAWRRILALHEELEGVRYGASVEPMEPGSGVTLRKDLEVAAFSADHRVPTLGFVASEVRHNLRPEWRGRVEADIRSAAGAGVAVSELVRHPLVAFCGDTGAGVFDLAPPAVFRAKVLLLECSFVEDRDRVRSAEWGHLHLEEIAARADVFENEVLVLTHLTLRTDPGEIRRAIARTLPPGLVARTVAFLPE